MDSLAASEAAAGTAIQIPLPFVITPAPPQTSG
jgi:hypothetical protein